jgi:hypothetical protein
MSQPFGSHNPRQCCLRLLVPRFYLSPCTRYPSFLWSCHSAWSHCFEDHLICAYQVPAASVTSGVLVGVHVSLAHVTVSPVFPLGPPSLSEHLRAFRSIFTIPRPDHLGLLTRTSSRRSTAIHHAWDIVLKLQCEYPSASHRTVRIIMILVVYRSLHAYNLVDKVGHGMMNI